MKVKYFSDTDTAHVEFTGNNVFETKEISENIYIKSDHCDKKVKKRCSRRVDWFEY